MFLWVINRYFCKLYRLNFTSFDFRKIYMPYITESGQYVGRYF
jgi:hypothetical protein